MGMSYREGIGAAHEINREAQTQVGAIVQADTAYQSAQADRGGTMTTTLTAGAEAAAERVNARRDRQLRELRDKVAAANDPAYDKHVAEVIAAAAFLVEKIRGLESIESQRAAFLKEAQLPQRPALFHPDLIIAVDGYAARCQRVVQQGSTVQVAKKAPRLPVPVPDFASLVQ